MDEIQEKTWLEGIFDGIKETALWVVEKLPDSPFNIPSKNLNWGMFGDGMGIFFDIKGILGDFALILGVVGVYYLYRWLMRFIKLD